MSHKCTLMNRLTGAPKTLLVETINDIKLNKLVG